MCTAFRQTESINESSLSYSPCNPCRVIPRTLFSNGNMSEGIGHKLLLNSRCFFTESMVEQEWSIFHVVSIINLQAFK